MELLAFIYAPWIFALIVFFSMIYFVDHEYTAGSTIVLLLAFVGAYFAFGFNVLHYLYINPLMSLAYVGGYLLIGILYSIFKWRFSFIPYVRKIYDDYYKSYYSTKQDGIAEQSISKKALDRTQSFLGFDVPIKIKDHKNKFLIGFFIGRCQLFGL